MNSVVIASKLESLRRCLDRITSKKPKSSDQLLEDIDMQDNLMLIFVVKLGHRSDIYRN